MSSRMRRCAALSIILGALSSTLQAFAVTTSPADRQRIRFEPNVGQAQPQARYVARGKAGLLMFKRDALQVRPRGSVRAVTLALIGARRIEPQGGNRLGSYSNYLTTMPSARALTHIANFGRLRYPGVYRGIDLIYYGRGQALEYDFRVAPGADPDAIRLRIDGADTLSLTANGDLSIKVGGQSIIEHRPEVYQRVHGRRRAVSGHFVVRGHTARFAIGAYDHNRPLVIDPVLTYSSYLGGDGEDDARGVMQVNSGGISGFYIAGTAASTNLPGTVGALQSSRSGNTDAYVAHYNNVGGLQWTTYLGGSGTEVAYALTVDDTAPIITGSTASTDFPVTASAVQTVYGGGVTDGFIAKLTDDGTALTYATYIGGSGLDSPRAIALDAGGSVYVTGTTDSGDFPVTAGVYQPTYGGGGGDAFVSHLSGNGAVLLYSTFFGGSGGEQANAIAVDSVGQAVIAGTTNSTDLAVLGADFQTTNAGGMDGFVTRFNGVGSAISLSSYLGGSSTDIANGVALDAGNDIDVVGQTFSYDFPTTTGVIQPATAGNGDAFVSRFNAGGTALDFSTYYGGSGQDGADAVALDRGDANAIWVAGYTASTDLPVTGGALQSTLNGSTDALLFGLTDDGTTTTFSSYYGGSDNEHAFGLALNVLGTPLIVGQTGSIDLPLSAGAAQATSGGGNDAFFAILGGGDRGHVHLVDAARTVGEGDGTDGFAVERVGGSFGRVVVHYQTADGSAVAGTDYTATSGDLVWEDGDDAPKYFVVPILDDSDVESPETFDIQLSGSSSGRPYLDAPQTETVTILDNEPHAGAGSVALGEASHSYPEYAPGATVCAARSGGSSGTARVDVVTADGTATAGEDYDPLLARLTWADGESGPHCTATSIIEDTLIEGDETFDYRLQNPNGGITLDSPTADVITIQDDDAVGHGSVQYVTGSTRVNEGDGSVSVTVERVGGSQGLIGSSVQTADGTATAGSDYADTSQPVIWADGEAGPKTVNIPITDDGVVESDETFSATLSSPTGGAMLGSPDHEVVTIIDNDAAPPPPTPGSLQFSPASYTVNEGDGSVTLTVTRSDGADGAVAVHYSAVGVTATAGSDFAATSGTLNWADGDAAPQTIVVPIVDDSDVESDETFQLHLDMPGGSATLGAADTATVTIHDNDVSTAGGVISVGSTTITADEFNVSRLICAERTGGSTGAASVDYAADDGTALAGSDYDIPDGTLRWDDGEDGLQCFTAMIVEDDVVEADETFTVTLAHATGAVLGTSTTSTVTIRDDDAPGPGELIVVPLDGTHATEGGAPSSLRFRVYRQNGSQGGVSAILSTADGTALDGSDYTGASLAVTFPDGFAGPGRVITVPIINDALPEPEETFTVHLTGVTGGASLGDPSTVPVTISDDDGAAPSPGQLQFSMSAYTAGEGAGSATITVLRSGGSSGAVSVQYATVDGTATHGSDYTAGNGVLTWDDGDDAPKTFTVPILEDAVVEGDETVTLRLSSPSAGATLGAVSTATLTIADDDSAAGGAASAGGALTAGGGAASPLWLLGLTLLVALKRRRFLWITLALMTPLHAAALPNSLYGGVRLGEISANLDAASVNTTLRDAGYNARSDGADNRFGGTVYLGYMFRPMVGVELDYSRGENAHLAVTGPYPADPTPLLRTLAERGLGYGERTALSIRGQFSPLRWLRLAARAGAFVWTGHADASVAGQRVTVTGRGGGYVLGFDALIPVWRGLRLGAGISYARATHDRRSSLFSGVVEWAFGDAR